MAKTPIGTRMRPTRMPLGCSRSSMIVADRVGHRRDLLAAQGDGLERGGVELEAVDQRRGEAGVARRGEVAAHWPRAGPPRSRAAAAPARAARRCAPPPATRRGCGSPPAPAFPCARRSPAGRPRSWPTLFQSRPRAAATDLALAGRAAPGGAQIARLRRPRDRSRAARLRAPATSRGRSSGSSARVSSKWISASNWRGRRAWK